MVVCGLESRRYQVHILAFDRFSKASDRFNTLSNQHCSFIHSFIPSACAECGDSLPFSGASSIPLCYIPFSTNCSFILPHFILPSISWSASALLFQNSYVIPFWKFCFFPFSVHAQTNIIYFTLLSPLQWVFLTIT
jgi:hypothetical protein